MTHRNLPLYGVLMLAGILGYLWGRIMTVRFSIPKTPLTFREDTRPLVPVVRLEGIRDGNLVGEAKGEVRLFLGDDLILPDGSGAFAVAAGPLLVNEITVEVPEWAQFVASKRGKKYYPVDSAEGEQIVADNRGYLETEKEAKAAG